MKTNKDTADGDETPDVQLENSPRKRIATVRKLFGTALNKNPPISQERLANWVGVGRDTIYYVERGHTKLSEKLADRLFRITGAPKDWLFGRDPVDSFNLDMLIRRYPIRFGRNQGEAQEDIPKEVKELEKTWKDAICPLLRYVKDYEPGAQLLPERLIEAFCASVRQGYTELPKAENLWMAYAFANSAEELRVPLKLKLLDPAIREFGAALPSNPELDLPLLNHLLLVLLGEIERGERPWPPAPVEHSRKV